MDSNEVFQKIYERNKNVIHSGSARNNTHSEFQKASNLYDISKKGFYTAIELTRIDGNFAEDQLQRYEHLVKHFDKQLLQQLKDREFQVQKIPLKITKNKESNMDGKGSNNNEEDAFMNRMSKIDAAGYLRNRLFYEFVDNKQDYENTKLLYYKEISLALQDGLISELEEGIHIKSMKNIEAELDDHLGGERGEDVRGGGGPGRGGRGRGGRGRGGRGRGGRGEGGRGRDKAGSSRGRYGSVQGSHRNRRKVYRKI